MTLLPNPTDKTLTEAELIAMSKDAARYQIFVKAIMSDDDSLFEGLEVDPSVPITKELIDTAMDAMRRNEK
jgi:hypothetical protein